MPGPKPSTVGEVLLMGLVMNPDPLLSTPRTTIKRLPKRGSYDRELAYSILDEALVCHIGFIANGTPFVIPTAYGRVDDLLFIHGSPASRMLRTLQSGLDICLTVTLVDGLVLARSAFHHSLNYRSVVVVGKATLVADPEQKQLALYAFTEHIVRGRWEEVRSPTPTEVQATTVLSLPLEEASVKTRSGPPLDDEEDYALPIWAGVLPLQLKAQAPIPDAKMDPGIPVPNSVTGYRLS